MAPAQHSPEKPVKQKLIYTNHSNLDKSLAITLKSFVLYNGKLCCVIKYNQKYIKIDPAVFLREQFLIQVRKVEKYLDNCTADDGKD